MSMYRYITLLWNQADHPATRVADYITAKLNELSPHSWRKAWEAPGIIVFDSGQYKGRMQTYCLADESGVVLGRLFRNDYTSVTEDLDAITSSTCIKTKGQHLIDNYWGRYVAFLNDRDSGKRYIMRDPSGAFPCFYTIFRNIEIYFSDMQDAANFNFLNFTINWDCIKTTISLPAIQTVHTGLNEVDEILPAERVEITPFSRNSHFIWDPTEISETDPVEDPAAAEELLRDTVQNTISALAGCYNRVIHNIGGLDSSIVLACLAGTKKRPHITCVNYYTESPRGEERYYTRQAATRFNTPLVEIKLDWRDADLSKLFNANKLARPQHFLNCTALNGHTLSLAKEENAEALFFGEGGDNVFFQPAVFLGALDYVRRHGLFSKRTAHVAMEASRYGRTALPRVFQAMLREQIAPAPCYDSVVNWLYGPFNAPLADPDLFRSDWRDQFLHPLLVPDQRAAKGKYLQILVSAFYHLPYYDPLDLDYSTERVSALLTQPIIETCLRIPIWTLTYGGIDRGLARKAFQNDLPPDIIRRLSKSTPSEFYNDIVDNNLDILREYLLDGAMVKEGILLHDKIEKTFHRSDPRSKVNKSQFMHYLGMESWIRGWAQRPAGNIEKIEVAV